MHQTLLQTSLIIEDEWYLQVRDEENDPKVVTLDCWTSQSCDVTGAGLHFKVCHVIHFNKKLLGSHLSSHLTHSS